MGEIRKTTDLTWFATSQLETREVFISPLSGLLTFQSRKWANVGVPTSIASKKEGKLVTKPSP